MMNNDQILLFFKNLYLSNFEYDKKALRVYGKITCIVYVCFLVHNESKCSERRVGSVTFLPFWGNYDRPTDQQTDMRIDWEVTHPKIMQKSAKYQNMAIRIELVIRL